MSSLKISLAILVVFFYSNVTGQSVFSETNNFERLTLRFNFLGLIDDFDQNISIGVEYRFNEHWSTGGDVAYIFHSIYLSQSKTVRGYIIRPFIRYYPDKKRTGFFEAQMHYKFVSYGITDWIDRDIINGVASYQEYTSFHYNKNVYGINIIAGTKENLSQDKKLKIELFMGVGYRHKKQGADEGSYLRQRGNNISIYNPKYSTLVLPMGASLVYDIK